MFGLQGSRLLCWIMLLCTMVLSVEAASRASFCKCICKSNYTIFPLDTGIVPGGRQVDPEEPIPRAKTCNDCNRQFCIFQRPLILEDCKPENKGKEEDIITQCFQRDSAKDQAVVYTFVVLTFGLLAYAAVKPWVEKRRDITS